MSSSNPWAKHYDPQDAKKPAVHYRNCDAARRAIYRAQPGYARHLDRDGDGIACEPYRGR